MDLYEEAEGFVFELSDEETDKLFEPYRGEGLSLMDLKNKVRFLKIEFSEWLDRMVGPQGTAWWVTTNAGDELRELWFAEKKHAMTFKLMHY